MGKAGGIIAIWGYNLITTHNEFINEAVEIFYNNIIGPYWDAERKYVEGNYADVPFGFSVAAEKAFFINNQWSLHDMIGYLNSWSAVQHFITANNYNPVDQVSSQLATYWIEGSLLPISFPFFLNLVELLSS